MSGIAELLLTFLPLFAIMGFANLAQRRRERGEAQNVTLWMAYLPLGALFALMAIAGLALQLAGPALLQQPELLESLGLTAADVLADFDSFALIGAGIWLPALLGILLLTPWVRRICARIIPIDAQNPVHGVALALSMLIVINLIVTLGVGLDNLADALGEQVAAGQTVTLVATLWTQQILMALLAAVGAGWLTRLDGAGMLRRLQLVAPSQAQVRIGVLTGLLMVPVIMLMQGVAAALGFGPDADVEALTEQLIGPLVQSPLGILTLGLAAALGEETIFRGALQPRFGLVLTAFLFALVHSNYGLSVSTVIVFVLGLVLGNLRIRHNTTTAMITHAVYNMSLGLMGYLAARLIGG